MVNFILNGLNNSVGLDTSPQYPTNFASVEADISSAFIATIDLSITNVVAAGITWSNFPINNLFYFKTTNPELTTSTSDGDMNFKCVSSNWPTILFSEAVVSSGKESVDVYSTSLKVPFTNAGNNDTGLDSTITTGNNYRVNSIGPARLAFQITGGYNNSDIFANEGDLRQQYFNLDASGNTGDSNAGIRENIRSKLEHEHAGTDASPSTNANATIDNVAREVLVQLLNGTTNDIKRVHTMISDASGGGTPAGNTSDLWIPILFAVGDSIRFKVTYNVTSIKDSTTGAAKDSNDKVLGSGIITDQEFEFRLNITT